MYLHEFCFVFPADRFLSVLHRPDPVIAEDSDSVPLLHEESEYTSDWERERIFLFSDALNTFYLRLYGVRHMIKDHSDSEKGNPLPPHRLLLLIISKGSFIYTIP